MEKTDYYNEDTKFQENKKTKLIKFENINMYKRIKIVEKIIILVYLKIVHYFNKFSNSRVLIIFVTA